MATISQKKMHTWLMKYWQVMSMGFPLEKCIQAVTRASLVFGVSSGLPWPHCHTWHRKSLEDGLRQWIIGWLSLSSCWSYGVFTLTSQRSQAYHLVGDNPEGILQFCCQTLGRWGRTQLDRSCCGPAWRYQQYLRSQNLGPLPVVI